MFLGKLLLISTASYMSLLFISTKASADAISNDDNQAETTTQTQIQRWNSYTPRQQQLAIKIRKIAHAYYQHTGKSLPVTSQSIAIVMSALGANLQEASFIQEQMVASFNAQATTPRMDALINRTRNLLNCLNYGGSSCIR